MKNLIKRIIDNYFLIYIDKWRKAPNLENGFQERKPTKTDYVHKDGVLGYVSKKELVPDCQWKKYMSKGELQKRQNRETMACVTYSAMNTIEGIVNFHIANNSEESKEIANIFTQFGLIVDGEANFSDRYIAKMSGTTMRGNTQTRVANAIRKYGLVPEIMWSWETNDYYATIPSGIIAKGKELLDYIEFKYEWVATKDFNTTKRYAPIQTSLYAYPREVNGIYQRTSRAKNHAVVNDGYEINKYDEIFDSYEPFNKKVAWNFGLGYGMLFTLKLKKKMPNPVDKFLEDYDGKNVKHKDSPAIWYIQQGKKKLYTSWLTYLAFNGLDRGYSEVSRELIERVPNGDNMELRKSSYWELLRHLKDPDNMNKLLEILNRND